MKCIFCDMLKSKKDWIYESDKCCCFEDINPVADVHYLIIPKIHIESLSEINDENSIYVSDIFESLSKIVRDRKISSYRLVSNTGELAGQSVHHLHFHILGGRAFAWPPG